MTPSSKLLIHANHGYALPGVLMVTGLTASIVALLFSLSLAVLNLAGDASRYRRNSATIDTAAVPSYSSTPTCNLIHQESSRLICSVVPRPFKVLPQHQSLSGTRSFSLGHIHSLASPCAGSKVTSAPTRSRLPSSPWTCTYKEKGASSLIHIESIHARVLHTLPTKDGSPPLIATFGDISITDSLKLTADSVIFAVGSISLKSVVSNSTTTRRLTLISMQGDISVDTKSDAILPLAFGRGAMQLPSSPFRPPYPILIESPYRRLLGVTRMRAIKHNT